MLTFDKSSMTNAAALGLLGASFMVTDPLFSPLLANCGLFALSGALTNWIAIHMLFEKVPLLYGSGIIELKFESLKKAIKAMVVNQFFSEAHIHALVEQEKAQAVDRLGGFTQAIDYDKLFEALVQAIMESSLGQMLQMVGGVKALEPLKESFIDKMQAMLEAHLNDESFKAKAVTMIDTQELVAPLQEKLSSMVQNRLDDMTPKMVKQLMKEIMKEHLGWLVVWGGVFGGLIGAVKTFI